MGRVFDPSASWIPAQLKRPVKEALEAGWTPGKDRIKAGGWFIYSPKKTEKFYIPITCKDPDNVAKKLRALISKAYLTETNAFEPDMAREPGKTDDLVRLSEGAVLDGAIIRPGPVPSIQCPDCDLEFTGWDAFAAHQAPCQERVRARLAEEQAAQVPEEQGEADVLSEGASQTVPDSTEPAQSGTIGTKEETSMASESTTPAPETKRTGAPTHNPKTGRKRGYSWTPVKGKENPLHEVLYEACRYTRRFKNETDSKYSLRLAQYIEDEGLLNRLAFDVDVEAGATLLLDQVRELLGIEESKPDEGAIEQLKQDIATKDEQIADLTKKVGEYSDFFSAMSEMAPKESK